MFLFTNKVIAQMSNENATVNNKNWQLLDYDQDGVYGASVNRAYTELLKGKKSYPVIVAVIDNGVDTAQEDLKGRIWTNTKEIPGNGIDDDYNGYIDDIHGWNFLGGKDGRSVIEETDEATREYFRLKPKFEIVKDSNDVREGDREEFEYWIKLKEKRQTDSLKYTNIYSSLSKGLSSILKSDNNDIILNELSGAKNYLNEIKSQLNKFKIMDPNAVRRDIVKDSVDDITDTHYGNNDISNNKGIVDESHGTHVSGVIAAIRHNGKGIDGIADNVLIMPIKMAPNGDGREKDLALSIRYAVANGAKIITMSFGKEYSPHKQWIDNAIKYAAEKDVLLIHAAGNGGHNDDSIPFYPDANYMQTKEKAPNFITVGASVRGKELIADFSNYGKKDVDVFAPGVDIYSTIPGNQYQAESGTSMASPVVAGVAALVLSYYPTLSAVQLKYVLEHSVMSVGDHEVTIPGNKGKIDFGGLSKTGGIVNAYNALKLAATIKGKRKISGK